MRVAPFLCVAGVEIVNGIRTWSYLMRGLGGPGWNVPVDDTRQITIEMGDPYTANYLPDYQDLSTTYTCGAQWQSLPVLPDVYRHRCLTCWCAALDGAGDDGYLSPAADPAPWYESTRPESGEFLGLLLDD